LHGNEQDDTISFTDATLSQTSTQAFYLCIELRVAKLYVVTVFAHCHECRFSVSL
jgi:hypothetical protein